MELMLHGCIMVGDVAFRSLIQVGRRTQRRRLPIHSAEGGIQHPSQNTGFKIGTSNRIDVKRWGQGVRLWGRARVARPCTE